MKVLHCIYDIQYFYVSFPLVAFEDSDRRYCAVDCAFALACTSHFVGCWNLEVANFASGESKPIARFKVTKLFQLLSMLAFN